jgi:hypothetical protein
MHAMSDWVVAEHDRMAQYTMTVKAMTIRDSIPTHRRMISASSTIY